LNGLFQALGLFKIIFNDLENKDLKNKNEIIFNPNNYNFLKVKFDELNNG
jgi:hypothetical protein